MKTIESEENSANIQNIENQLTNVESSITEIEGDLEILESADSTMAESIEALQLELNALSPSIDDHIASISASDFSPTL